MPGVIDLAELQREHQRNHGPCGCLQSDQCTSVRYLAIIERQQAVLARLEKRRGRLYKRLKEIAEGEHLALKTHDGPFEKCRFMSCADAYWSLRMGGPLRV